MTENIILKYLQNNTAYTQNEVLKKTMEKYKEEIALDYDCSSKKYNNICCYYNL